MLVGYATLSLYFIVAALVAVGLAFLLYATSRSPTAGILLIVATFVLDTWTNSLFALRFGLWVYPQDLTFVIIGLAASMRVLNTERLRRIPLFLVVLVLLLSALFVLGVLRYKTTAGVEFRGDFYFWGSAVYIATFRLDELRLERLQRYWLLAAGLLIPIIVFRWFADALGLDVARTWYDATNVPLRVINSGQTLFLSQGFVMGLAAIAAGTAGALLWLVTPFYGAFVLVLQHRSVWAVAAGAILVSIGLYRGGLAGAVALLLALGLAVGLVVTGARSTTGIEAVQTIERSAEMASTRVGTFAARIKGWGMGLQQWRSGSLLQQLAGSSYGGGYGIEFSGERGSVSFSPHNYYVQMLIRGGIVGLALMLALYASTLWRLLRIAFTTGDRSAKLLTLLLCTQLVYFIPYGVTFTQGLLLGAALVLARDYIIGSTPLKRAGGEKEWTALQS